MTNAYAQGDQYFNQLSAELPYPSDYLPDITATANELLKRIYRPNYKYRKVMIGLTGLENNTPPQLDLFNTTSNRAKQNAPLMQAFDQLNTRYGRGTIKLGCALTGKKPIDEETNLSWELRREYLSPRYTTNINDIPVVY